VRPLPRLLAFTDDRIAQLDDLGVRAAAIAAGGPAVALVARLPGGSADQLSALALRLLALTAPPMASLFVTGRADVALAVRATGVILRKDDLAVRDVRALGGGHVFRSVHSLAEAGAAVAEGADALVVGSIWTSASHPDRAPAGTELLREIVSLRCPTYAIGGVTADRAIEAREAGAWGVAAIGAVWDAGSPYQATMDILEKWSAV